MSETYANPTTGAIDREIFVGYYDRTYPALLRYCLRRVFIHAVAEDVVADVFLQAMRQFRSFPFADEVEFRRWVFRVASNAINALIRQTRRRREIEAALATMKAAKQESSSIGTLLDWPTVQRAILELPEREQTVLSLRFFADLPHDDIAQVVGGSPEAVRTCLSRTLARLRERFGTVSE